MSHDVLFLHAVEVRSMVETTRSQHDTRTTLSLVFFSVVRLRVVQLQWLSLHLLAYPMQVPLAWCFAPALPRHVSRAASQSHPHRRMNKTRPSRPWQGHNNDIGSVLSSSDGAHVDQELFARLCVLDESWLFVCVRLLWCSQQ